MKHHLLVVYLLTFVVHGKFSDGISKSRIHLTSFENQRNQIPRHKYHENIHPSVIISESGKMHTTFRAFGREFYVTLRRTDTILGNTNIIVYRRNNITRLDKKPSFYVGSMKVDDAWTPSDVVGIVVNNLFQGMITMPDDVLYIEPAEKYFDNVNGSVIYKQSDSLMSFASNPDDLRPNNESELYQYNESLPRYKRSTEKGARSCTLRLYADHRFYKVVGNSNVMTTIAAIYYRFKEADKIFRRTDFDQNGYGDNFGFELDEIVVVGDTYPAFYPLKEDTTDSELALARFTKIPHKGFCLMFGFTHLTWDNGVVGVAYTARSLTKTGNNGICSGRFNTGLISSAIDGRTASTASDVLVFVHELGHSCGSEHDESYPNNDDCVHSKNKGGSYIMTTFTTSPTHANSFKYSPCSVTSMNPIIATRACIIDGAGEPKCGNQIFEDGEECDCGRKTQCYQHDKCCTPSDDAHEDNRCKYKRSDGYVCSPLTSACCTTDCHATSEDKQCRGESSCKLASRCSGKSPYCPDSANKPDKTACSDGQFCFNGTCSMSICEVNDYKNCPCGDDSCERCCETKSGDCRKVTTLTLNIDNEKSKYLVYGTSCGDLNGICNNEHQCKTYSYDSTELLTMFDTTSAAWLANNWYYMLVAIAGSVGLAIFLFRKVHCHIFDNTSDAKRLGRLDALHEEINDVDHRMKEQKHKLEKLWNKVPERRAYIKAHDRLRALFPTTSDTKISQAIHMSSSEDVAVKQLLLQKSSIVHLFGSETILGMKRNSSL